MKFKIGDKVTLKEDYRFKDQQDGIGTIIANRLDDWYTIKWENDTSNGYEERGIVLHKAKDDTMLKLKEDMLKNGWRKKVIRWWNESKND